MYSSSELSASQEEHDAAKRLSDIVNSMCIAYPFDTVIHSWLAVNITDGSTDGNFYDSRADAVRFTDETRTFYLSLKEAPGGMDVRSALAVIRFHRGVYANGLFKMSDPDAPNGGSGMYMPLPREDLRNQTARLLNRAERRKKKGVH